MTGGILSPLVLKRLAEEVVARALESDINGLEVAMGDATQSHNTKYHIDALELVTSHINQYRNRLVPISWLPDEILLHIFHHAANIEWIFSYGEDTEQAYSVPNEPDVRSVYRDVFRLQLVCRGWCNLIESDPRFWTVISPGMVGAPLEKAISNSAYAKLVVLGQRDFDDKYHEVFLRQLASFSDRFYSLVLTKRWNQQAPFPIWRKHLPNLAKLWLVNFEDDIPLDQAEYFSGQPPPLRFLFALSSPLPPYPPLYESLEYLSVSGAINFGSNLLIDALPNTRRLRTLHLTINSGPYSPLGNVMQTEGCPPIIELPRLEVLGFRLCAPSFTVTLLERLKMPNFRTLRVRSQDVWLEPLVSVLSPFFHEALHKTVRPIALDLKDETFEFRTEAKTIFLSRPRSPRSAWPDFFVGYEPPTDAPINRVAVFLGTKDVQETPDPAALSSLISSNFILI
ncbi:hypothetical protein FRC04_002449 [Tulasnella sp. 424]|nr:hypothetical protein FRC04_002449 [Tulasnella sp. 424]KAG8967394.1 hypothetical protein FRC05_002104 [Tulasnella sp. 425]